MSALALTTSPPGSSARNESIDYARFVTIDEACRLLQVSDRHLRRLCQHTLERQQQAIFARPPASDGGGKACWMIARSYDLKLAAGAAGAVQQMPALDSYTQGQRDQAMRRMACAMALREARQSWSGTQQQWIQQLVETLQKKYPDVSVSQRTLLRWYTLFQTPSDLPKLIDRRGGNTRGAADPAAWSYFREIFLDDRQPSKESCWRRTRDEATARGWQWISLSAMKRAIDEHISPELAAKHRTPKVWRNSFSPYIQQHPEMFTAGQCWVGDHVTLDLWCLFEGRLIRPTLTSWMDWRTRRITGYKLSEVGHSSSILSAFRMGMLDEANMGGPSVVWIDNGKDFSSYTFHGSTKSERAAKIRESKISVALDETTSGGLFHLVGIEPHFSLAFNPTGKARLERWHGTLHEQFDKTFITYCSRSTDSRPEDLAELLKEKRQLIPSFEHVEARLGEHIAGYNASSEHNKNDLDGMSPDQALAAWCKVRRVAADPQAYDLFLAQWHKPKSVGRNGITIAIAGKSLSYGQYLPPLTRYKGTGQKLHIAYDPYNVTQIRVYDSDWSFITVAEMNGMGMERSDNPITRDHVGQLQADKNRHKRALEQVRRTRNTEYLSDAELLAQKAATPKQKPPSEGSLQIVRTPLDNQSKRIQLRRAVGSDVDQIRLDDLDLSGLHHSSDDGPSQIRFELTNSQPSALEALGEDDSMDAFIDHSKRIMDDDHFDVLGAITP